MLSLSRICSPNGVVRRTLTLFPHANVISNSIYSSRRCFHLCQVNSVKEIVEKKHNKTTYVEAIVTESERVPYLLKTEHDSHACPICRLNVNVKHTDVLILSQFVRKDGCMLPQRITGLCRMQQLRMSKLVSMAHIAGLMPNLVPAYSKKNCFQKRREWKKYNTYFEESTIRYRDSFYKREEQLKLEHYQRNNFSFTQPQQQQPTREEIFTISPKKLAFY